MACVYQKEKPDCLACNHYRWDGEQMACFAEEDAKETKWISVRVQNRFLPNEVFDALVEELSKYRHYYMHYKMCTDYKYAPKEGLFWETVTYPAGQYGDVRRYCDGISDEVWKFLKQNDYEYSAVRVFIVGRDDL